MSDNRKKIKGSAVATDDGLFIFTPYATREEGDKSLLLVKSTAHGTVWESANTFSIRLKIKKGALPNLTTLAAELIQLYDVIYKKSKKR